jgi:predicted nucleic acid-binding protein
MGNILLDSSVVIDLLKGRPGAVARLAALRKSGDRPCTCAVVAQEVWRGRRPAEEPAIHKLLANLRALPISVEAGIQAGAWQSDLRAQGITIADLDALIASVAAASDASVATTNVKDFPMTELEVEHWPSQ